MFHQLGTDTLQLYFWVVMEKPVQTTWLPKRISGHALDTKCCIIGNQFQRQGELEALPACEPRKVS